MIDSFKQRMMALLNEHVPEDIAMKGINAISPDIGSFLKKGMATGLPLAQGLNFLRNKFSGQSSGKMQEDPNQRPDERAAMRQKMQSENETETIKQGAKLGASAIGGLAGGQALGAIGSAAGNAIGANENKIEEKQKPPQEDLSLNYPDLFKFIQKEFNKGRTPQQVAAIARLPGNFEKMVKKFEKEKGLDLADYLQETFGKSEESLQNATDQLMEKMRTLKNPQQQQQGQGNQALLSAIDKIMKM